MITKSIDSVYLDIPAFMDRRGETVKKSAYRSRKLRYKMPALPFSKRPPKSKKFINAEMVWIHLTNECPNIGSGHRRVWAKRGRKWVHIADVNGYRGRLPLKQFEQLVREV
tara:strand:- start:353 stop:685 length:333 start_codon:yes stop_codon:yes gene_type:complete